MWIDKWIPAKYNVKSEVCAVEISYLDHGTTYYYTHVKIKNNKLQLADTGFSNDRMELPENIQKNKVPLVLVFNGKGVILKKIELSPDSIESTDELIRKHLPTINSNDFFVQVYKQENNTAFIALCRNELLNRDIETVSASYDLAGVMIGAPAIIGLKPIWDQFNSIPSGQSVASLTGGFLDTLTSIQEVDPEPLNFDGLMVPFQHTLGFGAALNYLLQLQISETNFSELNTIETRHTENNRFRFLMITAVSIAFLLAIVNVFFFSTYFDKNNKLETQLSVYQGKYDKINELLADYQKNKQLIENTGIMNKNRLSEYGDRIGQTIPGEITLSELYFNPKKETDESEDSLITFQTNHLVLKGSCSKSFIVNEWVNVLKMQKFIRSVNLEKYSYSHEGLLPNFEITLTTD